MLRYHQLPPKEKPPIVLGAQPGEGFWSRRGKGQGGRRLQCWGTLNLPLAYLSFYCDTFLYQHRQKFHRLNHLF
jgi:hypothetical protein